MFAFSSSTSFTEYVLNVERRLGGEEGGVGGHLSAAFHMHIYLESKLCVAACPRNNRGRMEK